MEFEEIRETLKKIGMGHNESKIYIMLLKIGPSMAGRIAKESNIDRSACYDSLRSLLKKGLISYVIEANRKRFAANPPERLVDFLKEKEELAEGILPGLKSMYMEDKERSQVAMYKGFKGIKSVFEDILHSAKGKENLVIDSSGVFFERMPYYAPHFVRGLEKNRIRVRQIARAGRELHPSRTTNVRLFPKELRRGVITTNIYCDKIAIILWEDVPEAVIIENRLAAESYKDYFEMMWKGVRRG